MRERVERKLKKLKAMVLSTSKRSRKIAGIAFVAAGAVLLSASLYPAGVALIASPKYAFTSGLPLPAVIAGALLGLGMHVLAFALLSSAMGPRIPLSERGRPWWKKPDMSSSDMISRSMEWHLSWCQYVLEPVIGMHILSLTKLDKGAVTFAVEKLSCGRDVIRHGTSIVRVSAHEFVDRPEKLDKWKHDADEAREDIQDLVAIWKAALDGVKLDPASSSRGITRLGQELGVDAMIDCWQGGVPVEDVTGMR